MFDYLRYLEEETSEANSLTNILVKVASLVFLLGMAVGFGFMPYFCNKCRQSPKFLGLSNAFSGGIFLGMGLFHILPESHELLEGMSQVPVAFFCAFGSYAIILFVEKVACDSHSLVHGAHDHDHEHEHDHEHSHEHEHQGEEEKEKNKQEDHQNCMSHGETQQENNIIVLQENGNQGGAENEKKKSDGVSNESPDEANIVEVSVRGDSERKIQQPENQPQENSKNSGNPNLKGVSSYVLLLALGFHGLFEGISLGIQLTVKGTIFLLIAIIAHKWAASLTLGISFVKAGVSKKQFIIMILIFAFITPVGIALGLILAKTANAYVEGIFLAISVGTFIYIACSEVIVDEFASKKNKYAKFGMFMLGAAVTAGLSLLELIDGFGHEHEGHDHEHEHE